MPEPEEHRHAVVVAPSASVRLDRAAAWLAERGRAEPLAIISATSDASGELARRTSSVLGATFGWSRTSLGRLAGELAKRALAVRGLTPVGALVMEALTRRVVHQLGLRGGLGRLARVADQPGLPRALARTITELRLAGLTGAGGGRGVEAVSPELARVQREVEEELARAGLADRRRVLELAASSAETSALVCQPLLFVDVELHDVTTRELVRVLARRSPAILATVPAGDARSVAHLSDALGVPAEELAGGPEAVGAPSGAPPSNALARAQRRLFAGAAFDHEPGGEEVTIISAPGEARECVEVARLALAEARRGVPFDRMAILLRAPGQYRPHVVEALRRARIPACFAAGTVRPDPAGRAMLALLACASEGLSARAFAEYLSLGVLPSAIGDGGPPAAPPRGDRFVPAELDLIGGAHAREEQEREADAPSEAGGGDPEGGPTGELDPELAEDAPVRAGTLRAPRRWERLLADAAVIGGRERWARRLAGLEGELSLDLAEARDDEVRRASIERVIHELGRLRRWALPILDLLADLPTAAPWSVWIEHLSVLASRAIGGPERVLSVLAELSPMGDVGPIELSEVQLVLSRRLTELVERPKGKKPGHLYVAPIDGCRGLSFDVVFVPGLAERVFPQKVSEDPLLLDDARARLGAELEVTRDRVLDERLALRLALGAAERRVVISYPRVDVDQARPRVPSFYGLEVLRASEGRLPGFDELARRAEAGGAARIGWPAPVEAQDAIDEAEHDLALLDRLIHLPESQLKGTARYLLDANPHLARALRFRARRWRPRWTPADGLVEPIPEALAALRAHALGARAYSPTALEKFATCPYQFLLHAVLRLSPREPSRAIEELGPLERGSLIHTIQFELLAELRRDGLLPVTRTTLPEARVRLDRIANEVALRFEDELSPAIARVWEDNVATLTADLREWLRRAAEEQTWAPWRFELGFGLVERRRDRDPASTPEPVALDCGLRLRGSIDLVERSARGSIRATDHKTGKVRAHAGAVINGGSTLQPVLYALALEKLLPGTTVEAGRLYYCTQTGDFEEVVIPLDAHARESAERVAETIGDALDRAFLPAAPAKGACEYCSYRPVCGPDEERRVARAKKQDALVALGRLRSLS